MYTANKIVMIDKINFPIEIIVVITYIIPTICVPLICYNGHEANMTTIKEVWSSSVWACNAWKSWINIIESSWKW